VHAGYDAKADTFRAFRLAGACVGASSEAFRLHLRSHPFNTGFALRLSLGQQGKLRDFGPDKKSRGCVFAGSHAGTAANAYGSVEGLVGRTLRNGNGVGIGYSSGVHGNVTARLLNAVKRRPVYDQIPDNRKCFCTPGLDDDGVSVRKAPHVQLAGSRLQWSVRTTVDVHRTCPTDTFTTVVIKRNGVFPFLYELRVEHVKHFQERHVR